MIGRTAATVVVVGLGLVTGVGRADVFNLPAGQKSLAFVTVGDPGNALDASNLGAVAYTYQMGKYDVTVAQYTQFLNAVAATDTYGLYNANMANPWPGGAYAAAYVGCGITRSGSSGSYTYSVIPGRENFPVNWVCWGDAARFCNWLSKGQPTGPQGPGTTETGSYALNGINDLHLDAITRNPMATYVVPTRDEWYKAAYYKGGSANAGYWLYPTRSDTIPTNVLSSTGSNNANYYDEYGTGNGGRTDPTNYLTEVGAFAASPGPYGTFDMGGDVLNMTDGWVWDRIADRSLADLRGGSFSGPVVRAYQAWSDAYRLSESSEIGLRISVAPEPTSVAILVLGAVGMLTRRRVAGS